MSFSMVDKVCSVSEECISTKKLLSIAEPVYEIHFPFRPVLPAVLLLEHIKQSIELYLNKGYGNQEGICFVKHIKKMKVYKSVAPGDIIQSDIICTKRDHNTYFFEARIISGAEEVAKIREIVVGLMKE